MPDIAIPSTKISNLFIFPLKGQFCIHITAERGEKQQIKLSDKDAVKLS